MISNPSQTNHWRITATIPGQTRSRGCSFCVGAMRIDTISRAPRFPTITSATVLNRGWIMSGGDFRSPPPPNRLTQSDRGRLRPANAAGQLLLAGAFHHRAAVDRVRSPDTGEEIFVAVAVEFQHAGIRGGV